MNNNYESHAISRRSFLKASGVVGAAGILAACGGNSGSSSTAASSGATSAPNTTGATPLKEFISWESTNRELESWNMLYSQMASDMNVTTNLWEGLLSFDCYGKAVPSVAKEWSHNEDSSVWTFNLRDDVDWVDVNGEVKAHLTSKDFLVGLEWVLNALKNEAFNTSMPSETVVGAAEYYDLTKDKGDAAADMTYEDMLAAGVGVEAPDDYTLVFTCKNPCPYFDTVAAYNSFYPASEDLIKELGIDGFRSCDYSTMWYNGPYLIEEYIQQNTKSFIPNPNYYAANDCTRFEHLTITMIPDLSMGLQLYENGEVDNIDLTESNLTTITSDSNNEHNKFLCEKRPTKFSYQMHLNFQRKDENGNLKDITDTITKDLDGKYEIPVGAKVTVTAKDAPEGMKFGEWSISDKTLLSDPDVPSTEKDLIFTMPDNPDGVKLSVVYLEESIGEEPNLVEKGALAGTVVVGSAALLYQGHMLGTELYLRYLLPHGAVIPQNRAELAVLLWQDAENPEPVSTTLYSDISDEDSAIQQAARWAVENDLMEQLDAEEHPDHFDPFVPVTFSDSIRAWKKAQELKK